MSKEDLLLRMRDPKFYLESFCKIKGKHKGLVPFLFNEAQKDCANAFLTNNRIIICKARQIGFCLDKDTRILSSDLKWITLNDIKIGQSIVATGEFPSGGSGIGRKMKNAIIEAKRIVYEEAFKLKMDNGEELIATAPHKFLTKVRSAKHTIWRTVHDIKIGDEIRFITKPWREPSYEDGWFGGMIDGEGSLSKKTRTGVSLTISQVEGEVWDRLLSYVTSNNLMFRIEWDRRKKGETSKFGSRPVGKIVLSNMSDVLKIIGQTRPSRFIKRKWWEDKALPASGHSWPKVVAIETLGKREMIDVQTSTKTFIAEGFVSHNSTLMTGLFYHNTIMNPATTTALIGYNSDMTSELLDKVKTFWKTTPKELRPAIKYNSKFEISFPALDSKILVLPSTENVGRGYTLSGGALVTELAMWQKAEEKMTALESAVPIDGKIVVESTPKGVGSLYHRMWISDNDYIKKEYGWWWHYTKEEIAIIEKRMNNPMRFAQEYSMEFLASGRSVFDPIVIKRGYQYIWKVGKNELTGIEVKVEDDLRIYKEPESDGLYVVGGDVSEGVEGGDYSVAVIWNRKTGEEVAFYRGLISPDRFGDKLNKWGRKYNNALMVVEVNNHGLTTLTILKKLIYPSIYFRLAKFETIGAKYTDRMGWRTTKVTRPLLIDDFAQALRDEVLLVHSKEILDEMSTFIYNDNGDMVSQGSYHDDTIFAAAIGFQGFKILYDKPLEQLNYEHHLPINFSY